MAAILSWPQCVNDLNQWSSEWEGLVDLQILCCESIFHPTKKLRILSTTPFKSEPWGGLNILRSRDKMVAIS